jgi:hypothetical protein
MSVYPSGMQTSLNGTARRRPERRPSDTRLSRCGFRHSGEKGHQQSGQQNLNAMETGYNGGDGHLESDSMYTRRDIGKVALGGLALSGTALKAFGATNDSAAGGVRLGATTWSLRDLPRIPGKDNIDDLIKPLKVRRRHRDRSLVVQTEPAGPNFGPAAPPPPAAYPVKIHHFTPEEIAMRQISPFANFFATTGSARQPAITRTSGRSSPPRASPSPLTR